MLKSFTPNTSVETSPIQPHCVLSATCILTKSTYLRFASLPSKVTAFEILKWLSAGVQIKDYGGIGGLKTINVRSMGTQHVGVFYDGVQLGNAQNGQVDLGKYSLDNMAAVTLYNGQKSSGVQSAKDYA